MSYEMARTRVVRVRGKVMRVIADSPPVGLGLSISDFNPLTLAQKIQAGADKLESNITQATGWLQTGVAKVDATAAGVESAANRVAAGVQGAARGGIAAAGTGDASSGLALASLTTTPALVIGGVLFVMWIFAKHPGHKDW